MRDPRKLRGPLLTSLFYIRLDIYIYIYEIHMVNVSLVVSGSRDKY